MQFEKIKRIKTKFLIQHWWCLLCDEHGTGSVARNAHFLQDHVGLDGLNLSCNYCAKKYSTEDEAADHCAVNHSYREWECRLCCDILGSIVGLIEHFESKHKCYVNLAQ